MQDGHMRSRAFWRSAFYAWSAWWCSGSCHPGATCGSVSRSRQFRRLGGELFYPNDDFELDLKLSNLTFSLDDELEILALTLAETHGFDDEDFERELEMAPIQTYGDLVVFLDRFWRRSKMKAGARSIDRAWDHPLADPVLDSRAFDGAANN
jgi:hypothetical protein